MKTNEPNYTAMLDYLEQQAAAATAASLLGKRGGRVNSAAQNAARRANGKRGGRPRKSSTGRKRQTRGTAKQA